jgi:hypothetical protein
MFTSNHLPSIPDLILIRRDTTNPCRQLVVMSGTTAVTTILSYTCLLRLLIRHTFHRQLIKLHLLSTTSWIKGFMITINNLTLHLRPHHISLHLQSAACRITVSA